MKTAFSSVLVEKLLPKTADSKLAHYEMWLVHSKVLTNLKQGSLNITNRKEDLDIHLNHKVKEDALKKIYNSDNYYTYERDQLIMSGKHAPEESMRRNRKKSILNEESLEKEEAAKEIQKDFIKKVKDWEKQKAKIAKKKVKIEMKKQRLQNSSAQKRKKQEQQIAQFLKLEKKKVIETRIQEIQNRKQARQQMLQDSSVVRYRSVPKYIKDEKLFKSRELKKSLQNQILLKNRKVSLQVNMNRIKQHEKAYIQRIKERINNKPKSLEKSDKSKSLEENFNYYKKDQQEMKKVQEKIKRIKKFESKLRLLPLKVDKQKKKQMAILNDKLKHPQKYNFLSQKALSDEQIYQNFPQFDINIDRNGIGNNYLDELRVQNRFLVKKVNSDKVLPANKPEVKDYLKQMRQKHRKIQSLDDFERFLNGDIQKYKGKNKEKNRNLLKERSAQLQKKVISSILELERLEKYPLMMKKEEQIDNNYTKVLKAKIALAQLQ